jgi:uncharacterized protein
MEQRNLYKHIWSALAAEKSMLFLAGPRQAGKTTLAKIIAESFTNKLYFNWDIPQDRKRFFETPFFFEQVERHDDSAPLIIFDEIHKYREWKNYLKGAYDAFKGKYSFLVSGSGRLDLYQKGSDSLAGRYFLFHLWPFTLAELGSANASFDAFYRDPLQLNMERHAELRKLWSRLSQLSGFPEPYLSGKETTYRRWSHTYSQQLIREDIRDMTDIKSIQDMETLFMLLPTKIGSPLSVPSLARDLKVAYNSVQSWLSVFERFFLLFSIYPWTTKISRAIQKERKVYMWDSPRIQDEAARFENMVALELYRAVTAWNDMGYGSFSLHFIKNKEQQEVDFLVARDRRPFLLVEAKLSDDQPTAALRKFQAELNVPAVQLISDAKTFKKVSNAHQAILIAPAFQWLSRLP